MRPIWQLWKGEVTDKDCDYIINAGKKAKEEDAKIFANPEDGNVNVRKNKVAWIKDDPTIQELQEWFFKEANKNAFGFNADYMPYPQFGTYGKDDFYDWHYDVNWEQDLAYDRKLSIVIQLSSPEHYEGGDFEFQGGLPQVEGFRERGSVLVFPSYLTHRVTKVTKGVRHSLVNWMEGPRWR